MQYRMIRPLSPPCVSTACFPLTVVGSVLYLEHTRVRQLFPPIFEYDPASLVCRTRWEVRRQRARPTSRRSRWTTTTWTEEGIYNVYIYIYMLFFSEGSRDSLGSPPSQPRAQTPTEGHSYIIMVDVTSLSLNTLTTRHRESRLVASFISENQMKRTIDVVWAFVRVIPTTVSQHILSRAWGDCC